MQQGVVQLEYFGAETFAVNMLGVLSLREVGILLTAIMVAAGPVRHSPLKSGL